MNHRSSRRDRFTASLMLLAGVAAASPALRAEHNPAVELGAVTVTGSRLPRSEAETASPIQTLTRDDIERSGHSSGARIGALHSFGGSSIGKNEVIGLQNASKPRHGTNGSGGNATTVFVDAADANGSTA